MKIFPKRIPGLPQGSKVRVTILDTGIDNRHHFISQGNWNIWEGNKYLFRDFSSPELPVNTIDDPVDEDGHGTFVAAILLRMIPEIELSIARIGRTRLSIRRDLNFSKKVARVCYLQFELLVV